MPNPETLIKQGIADIAPRTQVAVSERELNTAPVRYFHLELPFADSIIDPETMAAAATAKAVLGGLYVAQRLATRETEIVNLSPENPSDTELMSMVNSTYLIANIMDRLRDIYQFKPGQGNGTATLIDLTTNLMVTVKEIAEEKQILLPPSEEEAQIIPVPIKNLAQLKDMYGGTLQTIVHNANNPLTIALGNIQLVQLSRTMPAYRDKTFSKQKEAILGGFNGVNAKIANQMDALTGIEKSQAFTLPEIETMVSEALEDVYKNGILSRNSRAIFVADDVPENVLIFAKRSLLQTTIQNIANNAEKVYRALKNAGLPASGIFMINARLAHIGHSLELVCDDHGFGHDEERLTKGTFERIENHGYKDDPSVETCGEGLDTLSRRLRRECGGYLIPGRNENGGGRTIAGLQLITWDDLLVSQFAGAI